MPQEFYVNMFPVYENENDLLLDGLKISKILEGDKQRPDLDHYDSIFI